VQKFYFDIRDIFRAPRLALSGKKLFIQTSGLLCGYLGFLILTYLAHLLSDRRLSEVWGSFGFFPVHDFSFSGFLAWLAFIIGCLFFICIFLLSNAAVGKITYEQLKGDEFYSTKDSFKFLKKNWKTVLLSPPSILALVIILLICGIVIGLLGKIPYVGELGLGIFYGVPIFVVALFTAYTLFIFFIALLMTPAIVATTKEDVFETIVQLFSSIWTQPWRYFVYTGLSGFLAKLGAFVFGYFCFRGVQLVNWSVGVLMKDKLSEIIEGALGYLTVPSSILYFFSNIFPGIRFAYLIPEPGWGAGLNWSKGIAAFLIGITFILIVFVVISYALATLSVGQTLTYIIIRKKKDDENLLEKKTEEEEEEEAGAKEEEKKEESKSETPPGEIQK
jgi:predicted membrane protein